MMRPFVLALDFEGTLISNAVSQIPRPGLYEFLTQCREIFSRIVMFTTVREERFREIARLLVAEGVAPDWFAGIEYVSWTGPTKDLSFVPHVDWRQVVLVDDMQIYVHPGQESQWIPINCFEYPYPETDDSFVKIVCALKRYAAEPCEREN